MTSENWREAIAKIEKVTSSVTSTQEKLAELAGIKLPRKLPQLVASARLQAALHAELGFIAEIPVHHVQEEIIADLEKEGFRVSPKPEDRREAEAWISYLRLKLRLKAHKKLRLEAGDIVRADGNAGPRTGEVSSIGDDGKVYFKGGGGAAAWPDQLKVLSRKSDTSAAALAFKEEAATAAALRARTNSWSLAKEQQLNQYEVDEQLTKGVIEQLQEVIDAASDEKLIQQFIEENPQTLTALLGGRNRYLLSRHSLGGTYIPDFLLADTDSAGVRWLLVELETPNSTVTLNRSNEFDANARKGISQVKEWREWLQLNLGMARRVKSEGGLGLIDIRPQSEGIVLVGRRSRLLDNSSVMRSALREENRIHVHTYDWLVEQLYGNLKYSGPPALSPYVIPPLREKRESWLDDL